MFLNFSRGYSWNVGMMRVWKLGQYELEFDRKQDYSKYLPNLTKEDVIGSPYAVYEY